MTERSKGATALEKWRAAEEVSRRELAGRLGCSYEMVRYLEVDERRPGGPLAKLIEHVTGIPEDVWDVAADAPEAA